jgi:hypothetical protein
MSSTDTDQRYVPSTLQEFADHLTGCTSGCALRLDGTGPLCDEGQILADIDGETEAVTQFATILMGRLTRLPVVTAGSCPAGGDHTPGSTGEWVGRCTKCGNPC